MHEVDHQNHSFMLNLSSRPQQACIARLVQQTKTQFSYSKIYSYYITKITKNIV